jgi:hypothetical protein
MGVRDDGKPDRRHVESRDEAVVIRKVRELERERDSGNARKTCRAPFVADRLKHWVENIESRTVRFKTLAGHRTAVYRYLNPGLGAHRVDAIQPEHFEKPYAKLGKSGIGIYTQLQIHRAARAAFNEAIRRRVIVNGINPVSAARMRQSGVMHGRTAQGKAVSRPVRSAQASGDVPSLSRRLHRARAALPAAP